MVVRERGMVSEREGMVSERERDGSDVCCITGSYLRSTSRRSTIWTEFVLLMR